MRDIEHIIQAITAACPSVTVRQLEVLHPGADDDGLWFFKGPGSKFEVQIESPNGMCPLLIESDEGDFRFNSNSVQGAVETLLKLLHLEAPSGRPPLNE
jgi:hypothetical protein